MGPIITKKITRYAGDVKIPGFFCLPAGRGPFPVVIVLHGSDGFKPNHAEIAKKLAKEGFAALAPTWFGGDPARPHWDAVRPEDILATVFWLKKEAAVDASCLGFMGFSRGGGLALILGSLIPETKAIVNYFGFTSWSAERGDFPHLPLNKDALLDFVQRISGAILSFHGDLDAVVSVDNTYRLDEACRRFHVEHQYVIYSGVDHSFIWPGDKYDQKAHLDSWQKALQFLRQHLELK
jgi:carboxymethylenebutenolidase